MMDAMEWLDDAACRGMDAELFFPVGTAGPALMQIAEAKMVCAGCSVRSECLDWAFESGQEFGILGGMTAEERAAMVRRKLRTA